jgi:predicted protein tyrosine phosphatase
MYDRMSDMNNADTIIPSRRSVCGIEELPGFHAEGVTHVLSLVDPDLAEIDAFGRFSHHHRTILRFHDILAPRPGWVMPEPDHVAEILRFGARAGGWNSKQADAQHMLVHCHMGVSRSTAAMLTLMAQAHPEAGADQLFAELRAIRPQAWPNSRMIRFADDALGRAGQLNSALRRHYGQQLRAKPEFRTWMAELGRQTEIDMAVEAA